MIGDANTKGHRSTRGGYLRSKLNGPSLGYIFKLFPGQNRIIAYWRVDSYGSLCDSVKLTFGTEHQYMMMIRATILSL